MSISLVLVSFFGSLIAGATSIGGGLLVLGTMTYLLPVAVIIPLHAVVQLGSNAGRAVLLARQINWRIMLYGMSGAVVGILLGRHFLIELPSTALRLFVACAIPIVAWLPKPKSESGGKKHICLVGLVGGFLSMFVGAVGFMLAPFIYRASGEKTEAVASHAAVMVAINSLKVGAFFSLGFPYQEYSPLLLAMVVAGFLGTMIGKKILLRLPEKSFQLAFRGVISLVAIGLLLQIFV